MYNELLFRELQIDIARHIAIQSFPDPRCRCASGVIVGVRAVFPLPEGLERIVYPFRGGFMGFGSMCGAFFSGVLLLSFYLSESVKEDILMDFAEWFQAPFILGDGIFSMPVDTIGCEERLNSWGKNYGSPISTYGKTMETSEMCQRLTGAVSGYVVKILQDNFSKLSVCGVVEESWPVSHKTYVAL